MKVMQVPEGLGDNAGPWMRYRLAGRSVYMLPEPGGSQVRVVVEEAGAVHALGRVCDLGGLGCARLVLDPARQSWGSAAVRAQLLEHGAALWRRASDRTAATREAEVRGRAVYELWADVVAEQVVFIRRPAGPGPVVEDYLGFVDRLGDSTAAVHLDSTGAVPVGPLRVLQARARLRWQRALDALAGAGAERVAA